MTDCRFCDETEQRPADDFVAVDIGGSITISPVCSTCLRARHVPRDYPRDIRDAWRAAMRKLLGRGTA